MSHVKGAYLSEELLQEDEQRLAMARQPQPNQKIRESLHDLVQEALNVFEAGKQGTGANAKIELGTALVAYQRWYSKALPVISLLAPDRLKEFVTEYRLDKPVIESNPATFTISDYLLGLAPANGSFSPRNIFEGRLIRQYAILDSIEHRLDDALSNLRAQLGSEVFESEIQAARALLRIKQYRAAGAVGGVALEKHLKQITETHGLKVGKNPSIAHYNNALRDAGVIDTPQWRQIERLNELRAYCVHSKDRDPTPDEIDELINAADRIGNTIF